MDGNPEIPPWPAHLSPEERAAVLDRAALRHTAGGKPRWLLLSLAKSSILSRWHGERLASLEARLAALETKRGQK